MTLRFGLPVCYFAVAFALEILGGDLHWEAREGLLNKDDWKNVPFTDHVNYIFLCLRPFFLLHVNRF